MSVVSDNLIHFLGRAQNGSPDKQLEIFKLIIKNGFRCSPETIRFNPENWFRSEILCFTDIPLRECNEHTSIYGKFGIGVKKSFVKRAGGNPVSYFVDFHPNFQNKDLNIAARGALLHNLNLRNKIFDKVRVSINQNPLSGLFDNAGKEVVTAAELADFVKTEIFCSSFYKQMGDLGPARDDTNEIDLYYKEREWRIIPSALSEAVSLTVLGEGKEQYIQFERKDINMIVVPNEQIRQAVTDYFISLKDSTEARLKVFGTELLPIVNYDELHRW